MAGLMTYSFLDIHAALVGPGASISLGAGAGASEEGITIEPQGDVNNMAIGADGTPMHSLHANKGGHITCRFLKTSPVNRLLAQALAFQRTSASNHGQNTLTVVSAVSGDSITCQAVAFAKTPTVEYGVDGKMLEWRFDAGIVDVVLGGGFA